AVRRPGRRAARPGEFVAEPGALLAAAATVPCPTLGNRSGRTGPATDRQGGAMQAVVRIDEEVIGIEQFVRTWKLTGQFESLVEQFVRDRLTVRAARRHGV